MIPKEEIAFFVIGTPKIKRSAKSKIKGLVFLITVKVESVVYILSDDFSKTKGSFINYSRLFIERICIL